MVQIAEFQNVRHRGLMERWIPVEPRVKGVRGLRWSRLFGQVFRVFKWKDYSVSGRGGGNVKIGFIDFQGLWEGRETAYRFPGFPSNRHFHGLLA